MPPTPHHPLPLLPLLLVFLLLASSQRASARSTPDQHWKACGKSAIVDPGRCDKFCKRWKVAVPRPTCGTLCLKGCAHASEITSWAMVSKGGHQTKKHCKTLVTVYSNMMMRGADAQQKDALKFGCERAVDMMSSCVHDKLKMERQHDEAAKKAATPATPPPATPPPATTTAAPPPPPQPTTTASAILAPPKPTAAAAAAAADAADAAPAAANVAHALTPPAAGAADDPNDPASMCDEVEAKLERCVKTESDCQAALVVASSKTNTNTDTNTDRRRAAGENELDAPAAPVAAAAAAAAAAASPVPRRSGWITSFALWLHGLALTATGVTLWIGTGSSKASYLPRSAGEGGSGGGSSAAAPPIDTQRYMLQSLGLWVAVVGLASFGMGSASLGAATARWLCIVFIAAHGGKELGRRGKCGGVVLWSGRWPRNRV